MKRRELHRCALACLGIIALLVAASATSEAQTWRWQYVTHTTGAPPLAAQSTVVIAGGQLRMTYSVQLEQRQVAIESCHAALADVESAATVRAQTRAYLLVRLKPSRMASCASGKRAAVVLPTRDERDVRSVVDALNRACCAAPALAVRTPAATPAAKPSPTPRPSASPVAPRVAPIADWVETQGAFAFVRVHNAGSEPAAIRDIDVSACRAADIGCGSSKHEFTVRPGGTVTIATVATTHPSNVPGFHYGYTAVVGADRSTHGGSSAAAAPHGTPQMSARDVRTAQADALDILRTPLRVPTAAAIPQTIGPARLVKRGSSRLAIGVTGTALVRLVIAANGMPQEATIVSITNRRLAAAAIETAVSSTYAPATQNGRPIAAKYVATFSFDGEDPALAAVPLWKRSPSPTPADGPAAAEPTSPVSEPASPAATPDSSPAPTPPAVTPPTPTDMPTPAAEASPVATPRASAAPP